MTMIIRTNKDNKDHDDDEDREVGLERLVNIEY